LIEFKRGVKRQYIVGHRRVRGFEEVGMRNLINSVAATAICAMVAASLAPSQAAAGVVGIGEQTAIRSASPVEQIYYRRYYHRHYYHPYYRRHYYHRRYYGYNPYYYNPAAAVVGTAAAVATIPFWGWGYPY
jgi:hypothetical protein